MESLTQSTMPMSEARPLRSRIFGWSAIASGVGLLIVSEAPYLPSSIAFLILIASLALYLGMMPIAIWLYNGVMTRAGESDAGSSRVAEILGVVGALVAAITATLAVPHWLPAVPAAIITATATGVIGVWLLIANVQALRLRLLNRVLAVFGAIAGLSMLLAAVIMWVELSIGNLGSAVATFEGIRMFGTYVAEALYIIWALWLGIWLLVRRK